MHVVKYLENNIVLNFGPIKLKLLKKIVNLTFDLVNKMTLTLGHQGYGTYMEITFRQVKVVS